MDIQVLSVSSKGQVALPVSMRKRLTIENGTKLAAYATDDTIMLKVIKLPSVDDFKASLDMASDWAKSVGYTENDVDNIVKSYRRNRK